MLFVSLAGFLLALILFIFSRLLKAGVWPWLSLVPATLFVYLLNLGMKGQELQETLNWVPNLDVALAFRLDGLSLLFASVITGIGTLVFLYSANYMKGYALVGRFYAYLSMFMGAMLGMALSDNVITLFIFWEFTSITSFFLIGFNHEDEASRKSALVALGITGGGGLLLLAGLVMMGYVSGTYSFSEWLQSDTGIFTQSSWYPLILFFVLAGAFTKSAQFPFHFWLPGAMKAPTPVSTYLHSATMVKAGVFLLARFSPVLSGHEAWSISLMLVGGITMLYGAYHSIFRYDLKGILAYSTVSALGILVFLLGIGSEYAITAAGAFIVVHALYKAALFLITGILDKCTGSRDVSQLSGLRLVMAPVAVAGLLAALSSAGLPPFMGFVGKDLIYEATLKEQAGIWLTGLALVTNVLLLAAGFLAGIKPFAGNLPESLRQVKMPSPFLFVPPLLLGLLGLIFGLFPSLLDEWLIKNMAESVGSGTFPALKLWHGFNTVLALSALTLLLGVVLYWRLRPGQRLADVMERWETVSPMQLGTKFVEGFSWLSKRYTYLLLNGYLRFYVFVSIAFLMLLMGMELLKTPIQIQLNTDRLSVHVIIIMTVMCSAALLATFAKTRLAAIASMSIVGFSTCLLFLFFSAPDLAMTQFAIETLTLVMFLLIIFTLPKYLNYSNPMLRLRDGLLSSAFGFMIFLVAMSVLAVEPNKDVSAFYAENAYTLAKGKNVVNVILVDFRGIDTLIEVVVLSIAAVGVYSLLKLNKESREDLEA
jgi:multicomponent Na+:H+ antiporter subunit A